jgi:hypothetical protein
MSVRSAWAIIETDRVNQILYIEDVCHLTGGMSITNDAENVLHHIHDIYGYTWRVVYKDTDQAWWEIVDHILVVQVNPWHGLAWDILQR